MQFLKNTIRSYAMLQETYIKNIVRKAVVIVAGLFIAISACGHFLGDTTTFSIYPVNRVLSFTAKKEMSKGETMNRLKQKAEMARDYANANGYNMVYCFLVDMHMPSGKNRFFVYNLETDSVEIAGLVSHGKGSENGSEDLSFSNKPNSYCTSLGRYKIGRSYNGDFGLSYKLMGLDKTNNKAFTRSVVLHSYNGVPNKEVYPALICVSEGCPTVSPEFLSQVKTYLDASQQPILLWIYY